MGRDLGEIVKLQSEGEEIKVFISNRESRCDECGEDLGSKAWITLAGEKGALCLFLKGRK